MTNMNKILELMRLLDVLRSKLTLAGFAAETLYDQVELALEEISRLRRAGAKNHD